MNQKIPATPQPDLANASDNEPGSESPFDLSSLAKVCYTSGIMAKTADFTSPMALFHLNSSSRKSKSYDFTDSETEGSLVSQRLGITRPAYSLSEDDESAASHRIGIERPFYDVSPSEIPLSPLNLYLEKKENSPTPNLVTIGDDDSEGPASPWDFKRLHPSPSPATKQSEDEKEEIDDGHERLVHKHTADGHYLFNSAPLDAPMEGMRYSLTQGKRAMSSNMRRASESQFTAPKTRPVIPRTMSMPNHVQSDKTALFKVFLLLIQPKSKIFELIQVFYTPSETTIGDLLAMIPTNATEPALGTQQYAGFCRPKDGDEIINTSLMASSHNSEADCAKITLGEILVAIPVGYNGAQCAAISQPILANRKILKLLKRSDPLAPKRKKSTKHRSRRSRENITNVETVKEEDEEISVESRERRLEMKLAIEHAAFAAAATNAEVVTGGEMSERKCDVSSIPLINIFSVEDRHLTKPISTIDVHHPLKRSTSNADESMDCSFSSIQSLSDSLRSSLTFQSLSKRMPRRTTRRRHRRNKQKTYMLRMAAAALTFMVGRFVTDVERGNTSTDAVLGILGLVQCLILFLGLIKMQKYVNNMGESSEKCPVMNFANNAFDKYHNMYSNPIPDMGPVM